MPLPQDILVNRAENIVTAAFQSLEGQLLFFNALRPFSLWDIYYGINPSITPNWFQLLNYRTILAYDNKGSVARKIKEYGIDDVFPASYFSVAEALADAPSQETVWFIKPTYGTAGKGIECVTTNSCTCLMTVLSWCMVSLIVQTPPIMLVTTLLRAA